MISRIYVAVLVLSCTVSALSVLEPYAHISCSEDGRFYFKMIPSTDCSVKGHGRFYYVTQEPDNDRLLWETKGWYAYSVFVHPDGKHLIRIGHHEPPGMFSDCEKKNPANTILVAFYKDGQPVRGYKASDLIKKPSRAMRNEMKVEVYDFFNEVTGFVGGNKEKFRVVTCDNIEYVFDIDKGTIVLRLPL